MADNPSKLIHIGLIQKIYVGKAYIFLRKQTENHYCWFEEGINEQETEIFSASSISEAMRLAHRTFKPQSFRTVICGFCYTLPERDEHGMNALFYQMAASYNSSNGVYFDEELGYNCFVQNASLEARNLLERLKRQQKI